MIEKLPHRLPSNNQPKATLITRLIQGYETHAFRSNFDSWPSSTAPSAENRGKVAEDRGKVSVFYRSSLPSFDLGDISTEPCKFLTKHNSSSNSHRTNRFPEGSPSDGLQRQLQQLFHLHDSGLDQTFIDDLPVFMCNKVVGANEPFDYAVCLCEFSENDKLRLLPTCSHAFHINCIDTWLLSNSTCPLCRNTLFDPGFSMDNPMFDFDDPHEADESGIPAGLKTVEPEQTQVEKGGFW
ncbi:putative transcription factor C2H2 family [Helianthus annuus]|nr:putative transcription factor C2H2 family [Helianthus annuus]KAJ0784607.1 putative transcription factor C2H2 family [Helianthus annuus]